MNSDTPSSDNDLPVYDSETDAFYSLEIIAELANIDSQIVLHYHALGLVSSASNHATPEAPFNNESLRQLCRIQHLRDTCGVNDTGLKLILDLLEEVERLRHERRLQMR